MATLRLEAKFTGRKERNSIAIKRLAYCSNRLNFCCKPNAIFYSRAIFKFSVCLFATRNWDFLLEKDTQHTNKITKTFLFLGFGYKVNVRFNFRSQKTQAGIQVSSAVLFRVSLFNRFIIEKGLSQITNSEHIFSIKSLKREKLPSCTPGYPSIILKLLP